jgi:hypothetical protein
VRVVALLLSIWIGWRWIGFLAGITRVRQFEGIVRREARSTVITRGALNVFLSVGALYLWAAALHRQPSNVFVGFLAATMMISLAIGVMNALMQPQERTPEVLDVCRVIRRG